MVPHFLHGIPRKECLAVFFVYEVKKKRKHRHSTLSSIVSDLDIIDRVRGS